jgi:hypothetical protein
MLAGRDRVGLLLSILIVTEAEFERLALFVAEHVNVVPAVSVEILVGLQFVEEKMPDCGSVTDQLNDTLLIYQPFNPSVPLTVGVMTGAVLSKMGVVL